MTLTHCTDLRPASWVANSALPWDQLACFGPEGFEAAARLRFLPDPEVDGQNTPSGTQESDLVVLKRAFAVLAEYTETPDDCYFCLWEGHGELHPGSVAVISWNSTDDSTTSPAIAPAFGDEVMNGPQVEIPGRSYYLFQGVLADAGEWGMADMWPGANRFGRDSVPPAFTWPADHAWCVAFDVDSHWAGIGAKADVIERLIDNPDLDVVRTEPGEHVPYYW